MNAFYLLLFVCLKHNDRYKLRSKIVICHCLFGILFFFLRKKKWPLKKQRVGIYQMTAIPMVTLAFSVICKWLFCPSFWPLSITFGCIEFWHAYRSIRGTYFHSHQMCRNRKNQIASIHLCVFLVFFFFLLQIILHVVLKSIHGWS